MLWRQGSDSGRGLRPGCAAAMLLALAASVAPAGAQIDLSGRWHVSLFVSTFGITLERSLTLAQSGSTLTVVAPVPGNYTGGVIDPVTGALHLDGQGSCTDFFTGQVTLVPWRIDAVAAPDGSTFSGTAAESIQPTRSCLDASGPVEGVRLPDDCGNGVVDPGEPCDDGLSGGLCCTEFCTPRPAGSWCGAPVDACAETGQCDGAGTCVPIPKPAGTLCRLPGGPCDTAERCDGISTACPPPSTPSGPDADGDGVLDPCDDCVGQPIEAAFLRIGRFGTTSTRDAVSLRARVRLPAGLSLPDPVTTWKLIELRDATGAPLLYAQVPPGPWDDGLAQGWRRRGRRWTFRIGEPITGGVSRVRIAPVASAPDLYDVRVTTRNARLLDVVPVPPLELKLILDGLGPSVQCGQRRFGLPGAQSPSCTAPNESGVIVCR